MHSRAMFTGRFGSLVEAYRRIGYQPADNYEYVEVNKNLALLQAASTAALAADLTSVGATVS
jgi:hypothetical protein